MQAAVASGAFIKRSLGKVKSVTYKGRINIVTDVDKKAERIVISHIKKHFPGHSILSEESAPEKTDSRYRWVIDPIDGTTNFAHSFPFFCVSIGLEADNEVVLGVVYDPMREEIFSAERGRGAFLNGKRIRVSKVKKLKDGLIATGFTYEITRSHRNNIENFSRVLMAAQAIRRAGSAALDLCYVACGRFDGFWELDLHPWDSAAGSIIVREAEGCVTRFDGSPYRHFNKDILATNGYIHPRMVSLLRKSVSK